MKKPFNMLKLQQDVLKIDEKENLTKPGIYKERPAIILEGGTAAYIFLKDDCKIDIHKLRNLSVTFDNMIDGFERAATEDIRITGKEYYLNNILVRFNDDIYVNEKRISAYIDINSPEISFKGSWYNQPVLVYFYEQLIAVIMPTNTRKKNKAESEDEHANKD